MITSRVDANGPLKNVLIVGGKVGAAGRNAGRLRLTAGEKTRFRQRSYAARESSEVRPFFEDKEYLHRNHLCRRD